MPLARVPDKEHPAAYPADHELVAAARIGDRQAMEALIDRHYARVLGLLTYLTRDPELAQDLTQDAFLLASQRLTQLRQDGSFLAWLCQIARHLALSQQRARRWRFMPLDRLHTQLTPATVWPGVRSGIEDCHERELIEQVFAQLSPAAGEVLLLRHLVGLNTTHLALVLEITPSAAQRRLNRAEAGFRQRYRALTRPESLVRESAQHL
jgi:RNA polymerase sigma-70 factor (ECF subfamily)